MTGQQISDLVTFLYVNDLLSSWWVNGWKDLPTDRVHKLIVNKNLSTQTEHRWHY